jgi:hypothetical protein
MVNGKNILNLNISNKMNQAALRLNMVAGRYNQIYQE